MDAADVGGILFSLYLQAQGYVGQDGAPLEEVIPLEHVPDVGTAFRQGASVDPDLPGFSL